MNVTVNDLMTSEVMTATPGQRVGHVRDVISRNKVHMLPVVNPEGEPIGVVSAKDLLGDVSSEATIRQVMTEKAYTVPRYAGTHIAARMMRNHHLHRLIVTHEQRVVGVISSFDLLRLVEDHRFTMKNAPTESKRKGGARGRDEAPSS